MQYEATCGARPWPKEQAGSVSGGAGSAVAVGALAIGVGDAGGSGGAKEQAATKHAESAKKIDVGSGERRRKRVSLWLDR